jgi:DNA polymerase elongation subunit (family B)
MKLLDLAFTLAYKARINFQDVYSPVKTWDAIIHNALLDKGVVVPQRKGNRSTRVIDGGYVKTPVPGMYEYVTSIDATSLYPSIMMLLNLSPECFVGMTDSSVQMLLNGHEFTDKRYAYGANGAMFSKDKLGIIPGLISEFMSNRKKAKSDMLTLQSEYEELKVMREALVAKNDREEIDRKMADISDRISALDNEQMAIKILMNALYGGMSNEGFRFFNQDVAEAITTTGQLFLRTIDQRLSKMISEKFGVKDRDYVPYQDTDSVYLHLEEVVKKFVPESTPIEKKIKVLEMVTSKQIQPMVNQICNDVSDTLNVYDRKISFKLEIAADKAIFVAKKKYAARVYSSEGVTYSKPKLKVMGLEMVRSSTPMYVRDKLKEAFDLIFETDEKTVQGFIENTKKEFLSLTPEEVARPTGVKGIAERESGLKSDLGTPIHVRASMLYNQHIKQLNLQSVYHLIKEGEKIKYVYLKMPNPIKQNVIAWPVDDELPKEFGLHKYVDFAGQFDKTFLSAIQIILNAIGWNAEHVDSLDDFFS